jgi:hypothetical protein
MIFLMKLICYVVSAAFFAAGFFLIFNEVIGAGMFVALLGVGGFFATSGVSRR